MSGIEAKVFGASLVSRDVGTSLLSACSTSSDIVVRTTLREAYDYLERDPQAACVDPDILREILKIKLAPNQMEKFESFLDNARKEETSLENIAELDFRVRKERAADALMSELAKPDRNLEAVDEKISEYSSLAKASQTELACIDVMDAIGYESSGKRMSLGIEGLDEVLEGELRSGHHVLVQGRPEMGKSLIAINMAVGLARSGMRGIYFENEEPFQITRSRLICCAAKCTKQQMEQFPERVAKAAGDVLKNIVVHPLYPGTVAEIERLSRGFDWIVVNQMRNVNTSTRMSRVESLEEVATGIRGVASRNDLLAISVTQAGDSATGKTVLTLGDVDFSNTGIPSQVDLMVGIGADEDMVKRNKRMLSLAKNKMTAVHANIPITIDTRRSLVLEEE